MPHSFEAHWLAQHIHLNDFLLDTGNFIILILKHITDIEFAEVLFGYND